MKSVQLLTEEYVRRSAQLTVQERLEFFEEFRQLVPLSVFEEKRRAVLETWEKSGVSQSNP
jgi:hypothetical protein